MKHLKTFEFWISETIARTDSKLEDIKRCKTLSDEEFLEILKKNCKNFSLSNDELWRNKVKGGDLELFTPNYRRADPLAFPKFFNRIENDENYPVVRKKSLIGGTKSDIVKKLVGADNYLVIPFDNSEIVFCPVVDLWAMDDERGKSSELVNKEPVSDKNFIKVSYTKHFTIPEKELGRIHTKRSNSSVGYEFFTSSPCLLVHESKLNWLRNNIK